MLLESKERDRNDVLLRYEKEGNLDNYQNQERKQFAFLERKIENFSGHALRKKKKKPKKKTKNKNKNKNTHTEVNKTKLVASRNHALLMLLFFENKMHLHNEGGTCTEILPYKITDYLLEIWDFSSRAQIVNSQVSLTCLFTKYYTV